MLWLDSNTDALSEMCQTNDGDDTEQSPWCGKTWCLHDGDRSAAGNNSAKCHKFPCVRNEAKHSQKNGCAEKIKTTIECVKNGKLKTTEGKSLSFSKKRSFGGGSCNGCGGGEKRKIKNGVGECCWKEYSVVVGVALLCYLNAFAGDFVHDDIPAITRNRDVTGQTPLLQVFRNDFWGTSMSDPSSHKSYRPLTTFSFRATHAIVGLQSTWFHICNIILHATASTLFTKVCFTVVGFQPRYAAMAGALFAAHPIHTEAVTGIVGRADVLACVFFLLSFLSYHGESNKSCVWKSIALATLSMLAKETGVMVLLLNICYDFYRSWHSIKRALLELKWNEESLRFSRRAAKVLMSLNFLLVFRLVVLQSSLPKFSNQDNPAAFHPCRHVRFMTFCYLTALNCWLLLFPATLSHDWQMGSVPLVTSLGDTRNLATCLFFGCLALLIYKGIADFEHQKHPPVVLGLILLVLPFLPATNLAVTVGFVVAERLLYIPSLGWTLLVVYGLQLLRLRIKYLFPGPVVFLIILIFCSRSLLRNRDWNSRESLIRSGLKTHPQNAKMHYNFANFMRDSGNIETAAVHYKEALRLWPGYASAHNNLGAIMYRPEDAEKHFLEAIRHSPHHVNAYYNLGQVYRRVNRTTEALRMLERCVILDSTYAPAYLLMAKLHALDGRKWVVGQLLKRVVKIHPKNPDHLAEYAEWLYDQGLKLNALNYYQRALRVTAHHKASLLGTTKILRAQGQLPRVHQFTIRSHIMARAESGNQIFTGDLYFRSWQLQRQFQQFSSNSPNIQQIENSFIQVPHLKRMKITSSTSTENFPKTISANKNVSMNPFTYLHKNLKLSRSFGANKGGMRGGEKRRRRRRRRRGGGGGEKDGEEENEEEGEGEEEEEEEDEEDEEDNSTGKCSAPDNNESMRITIIQGHHRLEPPYDFLSRNARTVARRVICFPLQPEKFPGEKSEVPT